MEWLLSVWNLAFAAPAPETAAGVSLLLGAWHWAQVGLMFGLVIMIHELGHFLAAKLCGVKVESFNIGFGTKRQRLWHKTIGGTDYSIRPFPLGGFVQLHGTFRPEEMAELEGGEKDSGKQEAKDGEDDKDTAKEAAKDIAAKSATLPDAAAKDATPKDDAGKSGGKRSIAEMTYDDAHALREKPYPVKILVYGSGVMFNFLSVAVVFSVMFMFGKDVLAPLPARLDDVPTTSPLYQAGLRSFDRIAKINGTKISKERDLGLQLALMESSQEAIPVSLEIARVEQPSADDPTTGAREVKRELVMPSAIAFADWVSTIGLHIPASVGGLVPGKPADKANLRKGDRIVSINGMPVRSWVEMTKIIRAHPNDELHLKVARGAERLDIAITPEAAEGDEGKIGQIGILAGNILTKRTANPALALYWGAGLAWDSLRDQVYALGKLFGRFRVKEIRRSVAGPVGILKMSYQSAQKGFSTLLSFFCLLSIALVICNIAPIPILDGGHILQATVEFLIRRPIPMKILIKVYNVAFVLLAGLFLLITSGDLFNIGEQWLGKKKAPAAVVAPAAPGSHGAGATSSSLAPREATSGSGAAAQPRN